LQRQGHSPGWGHFTSPLPVVPFPPFRPSRPFLHRAYDLGDVPGSVFPHTRYAFELLLVCGSGSSNKQQQPFFLQTFSGHPPCVCRSNSLCFSFFFILVRQSFVLVCVSSPHFLPFRLLDLPFFFPCVRFRERGVLQRQCSMVATSFLLVGFFLQIPLVYLVVSCESPFRVFPLSPTGHDPKVDLFVDFSVLLRL